MGGTFTQGLSLFLKLILIIPNINLTYFGVPPVKSDMIVAGEEYANEYLPNEHVFDKHSCQIKREKIFLRQIVVKSSMKLGLGIYFHFNKSHF